MSYGLYIFDNLFLELYLKAEIIRIFDSCLSLMRGIYSQLTFNNNNSVNFQKVTSRIMPTNWRDYEAIIWTLKQKNIKYN